MAALPKTFAVLFQDSLVEGVDKLEELRQKDASQLGPLQVPEELLQNADEERKDKIKLIQLEHEKLRQVSFVCTFSNV